MTPALGEPLMYVKSIPPVPEIVAVGLLKFRKDRSDSTRISASR